MLHGCAALHSFSSIPRNLFRFSLLATLGYSVPVQANLPLTVEDLLTVRDRYRIDIDLYYFNDSDDSALLAWRENSDQYNLDVGIRYGWSLETEVSASISWRYQEVRSQQVHYRNITSERGFQRATLGINHRFSPDNKTPALLGFFNLDLNRQQHWDNSAISGSIGLTAYRSLDPILMSLSASYRRGEQYSIDRIQIEPGDSVNIKPAFAFAVNPWITLSCGLQWQWRGGDKVDNKPQFIENTSTELLLGFGYHWSKDLSISINTNFALSENSGSVIRLGVIYKFDDSLSNYSATSVGK